MATAAAVSLTICSAPADAHTKALWPAIGPLLRLPAIPWPNWKPGHRGIDIGIEAGASVRSPADGRVVWVGEVAHLPSISILSEGLRYTLQPVTSTASVGDWVGRGDVIGTAVASTHCAQRTCLHWSVRRGADYLDPRWVAQPLLRRGSPR